MYLGGWFELCNFALMYFCIPDEVMNAICVCACVCVQVLNVFSMSLLENDLYVINYQNHSIVKIHRYDPVQPAALVSGTFGSPNIIKVFHHLRQPSCGFAFSNEWLLEQLEK